jgi:hypothetical protein
MLPRMADIPVQVKRSFTIKVASVLHVKLRSYFSAHKFPTRTRFCLLMVSLPGNTLASPLVHAEILVLRLCGSRVDPLSLRSARQD